MSASDQNGPPGRPMAAAIKQNGAKTPLVVASGKGTLAEEIVRIALERGIKVREDADLAQILTAIDVESPIPLEAFAAVTEILAYLYLAQGREDEPRWQG